MTRFSKRVAATAAALAILSSWAPTTLAQYQTERFIPIGESPGVSGKYSYIGQIVATDDAAGTITVADEDGQHTLTVTKKTDIWVDRSKSKVTNRIGSQADCRVGSRVEVMHAWDDKNVARWIKIAN